MSPWDPLTSDEPYELVDEGPVSANVVRGRLGLPPVSDYEHLRPVRPPERTGCLGLLLIALGFGGAAYLAGRRA